MQRDNKLYGPAVFSFAANNYIKWKFIPPVGGLMGESWEGLVRSVKPALRVTFPGKSSYREEILATVLTEVEAIANTRP